MTGCLVFAYMALGYNLFWRGLHDDMAHIPHLAILRAVQAFTYGPALVLFLMALGWGLERQHDYHAWAHETWPRP